MPVTVRPGSILIKEGTSLTGDRLVRSDAYVPGWRLVRNLNALGLDERIHEAGWTCSDAEDEINVTVYGLDLRKTVRKAVEQILANPQSAKCNFLAITRVASVASKRFLGVTYLTVAAHFRDFRKSFIPVPTTDAQIGDTMQSVVSPAVEEWLGGVEKTLEGIAMAESPLALISSS
jgi:hypothetical protein